jgi:hypothetical protein
MRIYCTILLLAVSAFSVNGQINDGRIRKQVLKWNNIDSIYKFVDPKDSTETYLHYLGVISSGNGRSYKLMTSIRIWGLSHRATTRVLIFNRKNQYIGNYYLGSVYDLPSKILKDELIFLNSKENPDCDPKMVTTVSFTKGIPKQFFRICKGLYGDIYSFSSNE